MIIANDFTVLRVIKEGYFLGSDKLGSTILVELSSLISLPIPTAKILTADRYSHIFHQNKVTSIERVEGSDSRSSALPRV